MGIDYTQGKLLNMLCRMARSPLPLDDRIREAWNAEGLPDALSDSDVAELDQSLIDQISSIRERAPKVDATTAPDLAADIVEVFVRCYKTPLAELVSDGTD